MQNTRLNRIFDVAVAGLQQWARNPWRRISLVAIALLLGFFFGTAVTTIAGQEARLDITIAAVLILGTEAISRLAYSRRAISKTFLVVLLNAFRIGFIYSMYVEALKLGS
ncbi:MAG: DUF565 domain-containing protein [Geitlerinemataceae cyanobacterium]